MRHSIAKWTFNFQNKQDNVVVKIRNYVRNFLKACLTYLHGLKHKLSRYYFSFYGQIFSEYSVVTLYHK